MLRVISAAGVLAALLWTSTAEAVSVTNRDDRDVKLTVIEGEAKQDHILKPSQELKEVCQKGCVIRLNDSESDEYELEGSEVVSIEEGYLYYDGPDAPAEPAPGAAGQPSGPGRQ
ncbi:MAG: hypothetical protein ABL908_14195 [Hyphomicrobium sp.]